MCRLRRRSTSRLRVTSASVRARPAYVCVCVCVTPVSRPGRQHTQYACGSTTRRVHLLITQLLDRNVTEKKYIIHIGSQAFSTSSLVFDTTIRRVFDYLKKSVFKLHSSCLLATTIKRLRYWWDRYVKFLEIEQRRRI